MAFVEATIKGENVWTRAQVRSLYLQLSSLKGIKDNDLNYAITRTLDHIKGIAEAVDDSKRIPLTDEFKLYIEAKQNLLKELSGGKVKQLEGQEVYDIDFTDKKVMKNFEQLDKEHDTAIQERTSDIKQYNEWVLGDVTEEIKLHKIYASKIPEGLDIDIWKVLTPMITYDSLTEEGDENAD